MVAELPGQAPPIVSVIIATYNSSMILKLSLQSLLHQDFTDFEARVVGDCCTDESESVVASFGDSRLHWTNLTSNSGSQGEPNNEGLRQANGRYVAYLGHDDLWFPNHLSGLLRFIEETKVDFVHALAATMDKEGPREATGPPTAGRTYENHSFPPSTWLHRSTIIEDCGLWGDHLQLGRLVDDDYSRRVYLTGKTIRFCPQLSVLKFPSRRFSIYSLQEEPPQAVYLERILTDSEKLRQQIFLDLAIAAAGRRHSMDEPLPEAFWRMFRIFRTRLYEIYGRDRWPLAPILRRRFQHRRKRQRRVRGLPPLS
jgi:glycosyltransferase involved in cell wall biosynthesis